MRGHPEPQRQRGITRFPLRAAVLEGPDDGIGNGNACTTA